MKERVLILGSNSDIAVELAHQFAKNGYDLILASRSLNKLKTVQSDLLARYKVDIEIQYFDAIDYQSHSKFYESISPKPKIVCCAFGYLGNQQEAQINWTETEQILASNFLGAVSILNIIAQEFEKRKTGTIIGISSVAAERGRASNYIYGSAKAGFSTYFSGLRNRLNQEGINVLTVLPGFVQTKMTKGLDLPPSLTAYPDEVAKDIFQAFRKKKNIVYSRWYWKWIMIGVKSIPEFLFKKIKF